MEIIAHIGAVAIKDAKFNRKEAIGIDCLVAGITMAHKDDEVRLSHGSVIFDDLYDYFKRKRSGRLA